MRRTGSSLALLAWIVLATGLLIGAEATSGDADAEDGDEGKHTRKEAGDEEGDGATRWPRILWAQRRHVLYVKLVTPELRPDTVAVAANDTHLTFVAQGRGGE